MPLHPICQGIANDIEDLENDRRDPDFRTKIAAIDAQIVTAREELEQCKRAHPNVPTPPPPPKPIRYAITVVLLDFGGIFGQSLPPMTGTIRSLTSPFSVETAVPTPATPLTLDFTSAAMPPSGACVVLVRDSGVPGDLFRSGLVSTLPPSPGSLTVFTAPPVPLSFSLIVTSIAGASPSIAVTIPTEIQVLAGVLTLGAFIPLSLIITGAVAPTSLAVTVTGTFTYQAFWFFTSTATFTLTFTAAPAPSADPYDRSRILSVTATAPTLAASGVLPVISAALAPTFASILASKIEVAVNSKIASDANAELKNSSLRLSPTAVICARRVAVLPSGVSLQLTASDLFGPAVLRALKDFAVAFTPPPQPDTQLVYTVTVTDLVTNAPISQANVTLRNFVGGSGGNLVAVIGPFATNANGQVTFDVALHSKIVIRTGGQTRVAAEAGARAGEERSVSVPPTLTVELAGFNTRTIVL